MNIEKKLKNLDQTALKILSIIFDNRWLQLDWFEIEEKFLFEMILQLSFLKNKEERLDAIKKSKITFLKDKLEGYYEKHEI